MLKKAIKFNTLLVLINSLYPFLIIQLLASRLNLFDIGQIFSLESLTKFTLLISSLGLSTYAVREISSRTDKSKLISEIFFLNILLSVFVTIGFILYSIILKEMISNYILIIILTAIVSLNFLNLDWAFYGLSDFKFLAIRNLIIKLVTYLALVVQIGKGSDHIIEYFIIILISVLILGYLNLKYLIKRRYLVLKYLNFDKQHLSLLILLGTSALFFGALSTLEVFIVSQINSYEYSAGYGFIIKFTRFATTIINGISLVLLPYYSISLSAGKQINFKYFNELVFIVSIIIMLILSIIKELIFQYVGHGKFNELQIEFELSLFMIPIIALSNNVVFNDFAAKKHDGVILRISLLHLTLTSSAIIIGSRFNLQTLLISLIGVHLIILVIISFYKKKLESSVIIGAKYILLGIFFAIGFIYTLSISDNNLFFLLLKLLSLLILMLYASRHLIKFRYV